MVAVDHLRVNNQVSWKYLLEWARAESRSVTCDTGEECGRQHDDAHPRPLELASEVSLSQIKGRKGDAASAETHQTCSEERLII